MTAGRWPSSVVFAAIAIGGVAACSHRSPGDERAARAVRGRSDLVIAAAWPWEARKGIRYGEGLDLAVEDINAGGGIAGRRLRIERLDDNELVDQGRRVAERISADPDIVAVVGHLQSYISVPAAAIYDLAGLVMIAPTATDPELTSRGYHRVFRTTFTDRQTGRQMAEFAARSGARRVAIEYSRNAYGRGLANAFEERATEQGVTIVARQSYDLAEQVSERTFETTIREWRRAELDAIFVAGEVPSAASFVAKARREGIRAPILGGDALGATALISLAGQAAEGTIVATFFHPDEPRVEVQRFVRAFDKRFGVRPDAGSALGYDAVRLLAEGMRRAGSADPETVATAIHALREWRGVTGQFEFDERGDRVSASIVKMVVRDGTFVHLPDLAAAAARR